MTAPAGIPHPFEFFGKLVWLDGKPLLDTIEPYRRHLLSTALYTFDADGRPTYNQVLSGKGKKNYKSTDLCLAALYRLLPWPSPQGNDCFILANDEQQAADDLSLVKKLVAVNPNLGVDLDVKAKEITRTDGGGKLEILPAKDIAGQHGKTYLFVGYDEIWNYKNYDLFEALAPDPTRPDALQWITSYASIFNHPGIPLFDMTKTGKRGDDPRMYFSWYSADYTTDPAFDREGLTREQRANPSLPSWTDGEGYLKQQKRRLPSHKYRRLHLNLPGASEGAFFDTESVLSCIVEGRKRLKPRRYPHAAGGGIRYSGFVDMSGGSSDDATIGIAHVNGHEDGEETTVLDLVMNQGRKPPFNARIAVKRFAKVFKQYDIHHIYGDKYAGETFRDDFLEHEISVSDCPPKTVLYEQLEPKINAGEVELLDNAKLQEQILCLVQKGTKIDHPSNEHDDWVNAAAGAIYFADGFSDTNFNDAQINESIFDPFSDGASEQMPWH